MKKKILFIFFFLFFTSTILNAQTLDYSATYGGNGYDEGICIIQALDGGFLVAGNAGSSGISGYNIWLLKLDEKYDTLWTRTLARPWNDFVNSICETYDHNIIVAGSTESADRNTNAWLLKLDENGHILWETTFEGMETTSANSVIQAKDSAFVVALSGFAGVMVIIKLDKHGGTIWAQSYEGSPSSIQQTNDLGYFIVGGKSLSTLISHAILLKLDENGDSLWTKTIPGNDNSGIIMGKQTPDSDYIIVGGKQLSTYETCLFFSKLEKDGDVVWEKYFSDTLVFPFLPYSIQQCNDNGFILAGTKYSGMDSHNISDFIFLKLDEKIEKEWALILNNSDQDEARCIMQLDNGNYIGTGKTNKELWIFTIEDKELGTELVPINNKLSISRNFPNPFKNSTNINYTIPQGRHEKIVIDLYNSKGILIKELLNTKQAGGDYSLTFNANSLPAGTYFYRIVMGKDVQTKKMILVK